MYHQQTSKFPILSVVIYHYNLYVLLFDLLFYICIVDFFHILLQLKILNLCLSKNKIFS